MKKKVRPTLIAIPKRKVDDDVKSAKPTEGEHLKIDEKKDVSPLSSRDRRQTRVKKMFEKGVNKIKGVNIITTTFINDGEKEESGSDYEDDSYYDDFDSD